MSSTYTAVIKQEADWWIGWIEEVPGVNCQESSREKLLSSLRETLIEAIDLNRAEALEAIGTGFEELKISESTSVESQVVPTPPSQSGMACGPYADEGVGTTFLASN